MATSPEETVDPKLSRKDRERERHRQEILRAAERIFARKGYQAATIEEIAREAEFAVGTLYSFFKNKDELYTRVIEGFIQQFMDEFREKVLSIDDPERAVAALIELRIRHFEMHREFIRISLELSPASRIDPCRSLPPELQAQHDAYLDAVIDLFRRGVERGIFDQADPLYLALAQDGIVNAFMAYWSRRPSDEPLERRIETIQREFIGRIKRQLPRP